MIVRLRSLPAPVRYLLYVFGVLAIFMLSIGMGMATATFVNWQSGTVSTNGQTEASMLHGRGPESTGETRTPEDTSSEPPIVVDHLDKKRSTTSFVHRATDENSRGDFTSITSPAIDGDPQAVVLASVQTERQDDEASSYAHNIGVWYTPVTHKWAIFNQDLAAVPAGSTFEIVVPAPSASFVHRADSGNSAGSYTYLDNSLTNGKRNVVLTVTQNWNPGGGRGVYNDHPIGTRYDADLGEWAVYNRDGAAMPDGAAFNVAVSAGTDESSK